MLIQSEFCNGKSLLEEIVQRQSRPLSGPATNGFNNEEMQTLISHCAKGLAYIHCQNLAHMDIKPGNIFRQIENDSCVYKIGDLGLVCPHTETVLMTETVDILLENSLNQLQIKIMTCDWLMYSH